MQKVFKKITQIKRKKKLQQMNLYYLQNKTIMNDIDMLEEKKRIMEKRNFFIIKLDMF